MNLAILFHSSYTVGIIVGLFFGILARLFSLRTDYRQYPTYPHGKIIHLSLAVIAAGLGAVAVPSLLEKNYVAITFLTVAAQQFRDVRNMERQSLAQIDSEELVKRGATYIEGIAMVFEGRNYMVIFTSLITSLFTVLLGWMWGVAVGLAGILISMIYKSGTCVSHIAEVTPARVSMEGPNLYVDDIYIMNIGLEKNQTIILERGLGLMVKPKNRDSRVTLANLGQRQAILHDLSVILGVYRDSGEPSLVPLAKLDLHSGRLGVFILPVNRDMDTAVKALKKVPVLESAVRMPTESGVL